MRSSDWSADVCSSDLLANLKKKAGTVASPSILVRGTSFGRRKGEMMQKRDEATLFSASDLVNFMGCTHATVLDIRQLDHPVEVGADDEQTQLLQETGLDRKSTRLNSRH